MKELEQIKPLLQKEEELTVYQELERCCEAIEEQIKNGVYQKPNVERAFMQLLSKELMYDSYFIYLLWFAVKCFKKADYLELFCELVASSDYMSALNKKFALYQVKSLLIKCPELETTKVKSLLVQLEQTIFAYFSQVFRLERRLKEQRNIGTVIVMTHGFLGENHPVSRSALERCVTLKREMGKEVVLISAGEDCTMEDSIPLYHVEVRNRINEYNGNHIYEYLGEQIVLCQPEKPASTLEGIAELLQLVINVNPEFVVYVGEQSVLADTINNFCPVLAVSTTFSVIQRTHTEFVMVGRTATSEERDQSYGEILETLFTFHLKGKKRDYTREELGIPQDKFVLAVVGTRLDSDVTPEFLDAMKPLMQEECYLLFIGRFEQYERWCEKLTWLAENSTSLGMVDDVTGILSCADLYVNPNRLGGGYSVAEAFDAGIPAVTTSYGDVAAAAGENFWVKDYQDMVELIKKYHIDSTFYGTMKAVAAQRLEELTRESGGFTDAVRRMQESPRFY